MDTSTAQVKKLLSGDYLTYCIGNLSYRANDVTLKTAIESRFPIKVDQAVVAYSSDGRSRGCAFATVRWKEYLDSHSDSKSQSLVQKLRHRMTGKPLFGRPVFVELACNQRVTWRLIWSQEEINFSTYSHGILVFKSRLTQPTPATRRRPTQEEHYYKHAEQGSHMPLSALAFVLRRRYDPRRRRSTGRAA